ncbi:hypothetical protein MUK42_06367 [Musa troglodytarum]|uniref:Uncharacterized protein n=1 Tax=Musa troglodytarum TaxID=320322 RepID=A0A9E7GJ65_9LILI|nr:hypothetical protein MUK42_06367 [Musa troglodytarum]
MRFDKVYSSPSLALGEGHCGRLPDRPCEDCHADCRMSTRIKMYTVYDYMSCQYMPKGVNIWVGQFVEGVMPKFICKVPGSPSRSIMQYLIFGARVCKAQVQNIFFSSSSELGFTVEKIQLSDALFEISQKRISYVLRITEFVNRTVLGLPEKSAVANTSIDQNESKELSHNS